MYNNKHGAEKNGRLGNNHLHTLQVTHKNASSQDFLSLSPYEAGFSAKKKTVY
jgi:hypothetical protein